ncbi:MAG: imidazole glycerol phosphate synthase subunit HisH [Micromonosporaceae bacterium]|nr:imidazole glycerol phosphate synthase subunit HisH [Micromonosporaceae bacterium]
MPTVVILDYGSGNLRSAERAVARAGAEVKVTSDLAAAEAADGLVVPGVGAFAACMAGIDALGARQVIAARVAAGRPVLGICVGMQVLFEYGDEHGVVTKGLGLLPGGVARLTAPRVPHMGWNSVEPPPGSTLFAGMPANARFYFVHSYAPQPTPRLLDGALVTRTTHGEEFVSAVEKGRIAATQFHPEKSGDCGARLLRNWVATL